MKQVVYENIDNCPGFC